MSSIHPTAIVDPAAQLDEGVTVGPYAIIGPAVKIGAGTVVGSHCVIEGRTTIGRDNRFYSHSSIGCMPQDMSHRGELTELVIGDRNTVFQYCTFSTGTHKEQGLTRVGSDNWIMAYVHLAHDVVLGNHCVLANNATLAGHVHVGDWAVIGGLTGVHQFVHIGAHAMIGFQAHVSQDVVPYMTVDGNPLAVRAVNLTGLKRRDFTPARITAIRQMHKLLFRQSLTLEQARSEIEALKGQGGDEDVQLMLDFLAGSKRGLVR
ncbi:acyl-ACP--UDP-N-acetylglucosamine O-acyltransferase [Inhella proteolytica]|uniref:Acyl-[acyl-carrier-protein]--UDP-N-acetylglucosamine O-acyltransferase n=1 Tax=Inhella proteolytica TaxID=2795029 RepID=A0A931J1A2_9BURK|nr:acyl-ACP--UDP-N-acetylglucosamine O-acyltransferase [Inhella proteolytica]MBH9577656.1 acyl-ACP--UDP-N-acetylglucosamine O-acyltransferase [Inhella proteolytica]